LLVSQVVDIALPLRIGHSFVSTLCTLRQSIVVLAALAIRHLSIYRRCSSRLRYLISRLIAASERKVRGSFG
jgi:hypothetical protein